MIAKKFGLAMEVAKKFGYKSRREGALEAQRLDGIN